MSMYIHFTGNLITFILWCLLSHCVCHKMHNHVDLCTPICTHRYDLSDEKRKKKEEFLMKERDDALKKARERKVDEMRVSGSIKDIINFLILLI